MLTFNKSFHVLKSFFPLIFFQSLHIWKAALGLWECFSLFKCFQIWPCSKLFLFASLQDASPSCFSFISTFSYQVLDNFVYPHSILTLQNRKIHQNTPFFNRAAGNLESGGGGGATKGQQVCVQPADKHWGHSLGPGLMLSKRNRTRKWTKHNLEMVVC